MCVWFGGLDKYQSHDLERSFNEMLKNGIFNLFLSYGANPDGVIYDSSVERTTFGYFLRNLLNCEEECFEEGLCSLDAF